MFSFAAFFSALVSVAAYYFDAWPVVFTFAFITLILGVIGLFFPDQNHPGANRISCVLAILLSFFPFAMPVVQQWRLHFLEARRARETKGQYESLESNVAEIGKIITKYHDQYHIYPDVDGTKILQYVTPKGLEQPPPMEGLEAPRDPFATAGGPVRWAAVRDNGIVLVSVGQDGVAELPLPGIMMDPPPAHPLAGFAQLGVDPRTRTYDPTNGALSLGDIVRFVGDKPYADTFAPLFKGWDLGEKYSPFKPSPKRRGTDPDPNPQSVRDSKAAARLLQEGQFLGAVSMASRSINERDIYPAQWKPEDYAADLTRGLALYQLGAFRAAADSLIDYTESQPNDAYAHFYLAAALYYGGRQQDAQIHVAAAAQIDPSSPIADQAYAAETSLEQQKKPAFPEPWIVSQEASSGRNNGQ